MNYLIREGEEELTVKTLLKRRLGFSTRLLRKLKEEGGVFLNGKPCRLVDHGKPGDQIRVEFPSETSHMEPEDIPLEVLYEDDDLLFINKPPGLVVHPTKGHPCGTVANGLTMRMQKRGENFKIRFVNRLDMDTSGVLVIAKNAFSQESLVRQMKENKTEKSYLAVVDGCPGEESGCIDLPIGLAGEHEIGRIVTPDGAPCRTYYRREAILSGGKRALLQIRLETGRTHQIRVHMSYIGFPVTGDSLYGKTQPELIGRQALHAASFSCSHPGTGVRLKIEAPVPEDIRKLIDVSNGEL